jgi:hypothetical protein
MWWLLGALVACSVDKAPPIGDEPADTDTPDPETEPAETDLPETDLPDTDPQETDLPADTDPVDADQDGAPTPLDCDDADPTAYPGAPETCDGVDNDCDGGEAGLVTFTPAGGAPTDVSAAWSVPGAAITLDTPGAVRVCEGTWRLSLTLTADVALEGFGAAILDARDRARVITAQGSQASVTRLRITHGQAEDGGCVAVRGGSLTLDEVVIEACAATRNGGGIAAQDADLTLIDSRVLGCAAEALGGGLNTEGGRLDLARSTVEANTATAGGGLALLSTTWSLVGSTILGNEAIQNAGGILAQYTPSGRIDLDSSVEGNAAVTDGGGLWTDDALTVVEGSVRGNTAGYAGGGLYATNAGELTLTGSVSGNTAERGGGFTVGNAAVILRGAVIEENHATSIGGGFWSFFAAVVEVHDAILRFNDAPDAAGALCNNTRLVWDGGEIRGNVANADAGGLYILDESTGSLTGVDIRDNTAARGAGLLVDDADLTVSGGTISDNAATAWGGGLWMPGYGRVTLAAVPFSGNTPDEVYAGAAVVVGPVATTVCEGGGCAP